MHFYNDFTISIDKAKMTINLSRWIYCLSIAHNRLRITFNFNTILSFFQQKMRLEWIPVPSVCTSRMHNVELSVQKLNPILDNEESQYTVHMRRMDG